MWYTIEDIDNFVESTRVLVYNIFGNTEQTLEEIDLNINNLNEESMAEINKCLTQDESMVILKDFAKQIPGTLEYKISTNRYLSFIDSLNSRMVSNLLHKMSADGILESAFDEETNDFIFWAKDNEQDQDNTEDKAL